MVGTENKRTVIRRTSLRSRVRPKSNVSRKGLIPAQQPRPAKGLAPLLVGGALIVAVLAILVISDLVLFSKHSKGVTFSNIQVTLAPTVEMQSLPWSDRLPKAGADQFDVSPNGSLIVRVGNTLYDFADGQPLMSDSAPGVQSFAFVSGALAVITKSGRLGYLSDNSFVDVDEVPYGASRIGAAANGGQLFFFGGSSNYSLSSLSADGTLHALVSSPEMIESVAGDQEHHIFSIGRSLFAQAGAENPKMLLNFPDADITGIAVSGETIYCATNKGIYQLQGVLAIPLALGVGGQLRLTTHGLLVLNNENKRMYRLVLRSSNV